MKADDKAVPRDPESLVSKVRERYGKIADGTASGAAGCGSGCCGSASPSAVSRGLGYDASELDAAPEGADLGLGCGAPIAHLDLKPGETVLDLGSGGGLDAALAAEKVGSEGKVIGVDMTPEMIERATEAAAKAGRTQVEFRQGRLEALPVDDDSVDAITSNCVINLVPDKSKVFREIARVLRRGGRLVVSDVVLDERLPEALERDLMMWIGCVSGALERDTYFEQLRSAGLTDIEILKDVDFLAAIGDEMPQDVRELAAASGVRPEEMRGKVRSITYRAIKP
jgi:arsenite methyltransferase